MLADLKHLRLRIWRPLPELPDEPQGEEEEDLMQTEERERYNTGPWTFGEPPDDLCFVGQNEAEFDAVGGVEASVSALNLALQS